MSASCPGASAPSSLSRPTRRATLIGCLQGLHRGQACLHQKAELVVQAGNREAVGIERVGPRDDRDAGAAHAPNQLLLSGRSCG